MGVHSSEVYQKKKKLLSVISLNYSGILLSPFQFFSKESEIMSNIQTSLSNIFKVLLKKYHSNFSENKKQSKFKWNLGKIDQKMQKQRYSPLYGRQVGIQNKKLLNEKQFKEKWISVFNHNIEMFKQKQPGFKYTQQQKNQALQFDLLCFKTVLVHVYKQLRQFQFEKIDQLDYKQYKNFMNYMFNKSFLNEEKKLKKTFEAMQKQKIDVVFAQEADDKLIQRIKQKSQYVVFKSQNGNSIIVIRKDRFSKYYSLSHNPLDNLPDLKKNLIWNDDTVVAFVDNLILISGHLSSKKQKNAQQVYDMMHSLRVLNAIYPMCHIIVGCDVNSFCPDTYANYCRDNKIYCKCKKVPAIHYKTQLQKKEVHKEKIEQISSLQKIDINEHKFIQDCQCFKPSNCQIFPYNRNMFTTSKQRTYLQPQVNKAEQMARVCRDHLIIFKGDNLHIQKAMVCTILDKGTNEVQNLPCQEHPYDHYVVKLQIAVNVVTNFGVSEE